MICKIHRVWYMHRSVIYRWEKNNVWYDERRNYPLPIGNELTEEQRHKDAQERRVIYRWEKNNVWYDERRNYPIPNGNELTEEQRHKDIDRLMKRLMKRDKGYYDL